jgi:hypothetical protein
MYDDDVSSDGPCLAEELASLPPGPRLAALLASVDRRRLKGADLVRLARARQRLAAHVQGELLGDLYAVAQLPYEEERPPPRDDPPWPNVWAEAEVAFALAWTGRRAAAQLVLAQQVVERLPAVGRALAAGEIDVPKALVFVDALANVDDAVAHRLVDEVIDAAGRLTTGQLRVRLRRLVLAAAPESVLARAAASSADRRVQVQLGDDGLGELAGYHLAPHRVAAAMERLTAIAVAAKRAGDRRRIDHLRADAMLDLLVGDGVAVGGPVTDGAFSQGDEAAWSPAGDHADGDPELRRLWSAGFAGLATTRPTPRPGATPMSRPDTAPQVHRGALPAPRRGVIELQVPLTTLLRLSSQPGELGGWGPVVADLARRIVAGEHDATWRFNVTDDLGEVIHHGITRARPVGEPPAKVAAFVRARDGTCRAPGCRRPARTCDLDHTVARADGGGHTADNLGALCRKHHAFKHSPGTTLEQLRPGVFGWTTPNGMQYVTAPARAGP